MQAAQSSQLLLTTRIGNELEHNDTFAVLDFGVLLQPILVELGTLRHIENAEWHGVVYHAVVVNVGNLGENMSVFGRFVEDWWWR